MLHHIQGYQGAGAAVRWARRTVQGGGAGEALDEGEEGVRNVRRRDRPVEAQVCCGHAGHGGDGAAAVRRVEPHDGLHAVLLQGVEEMVGMQRFGIAEEIGVVMRQIWRCHISLCRAQSFAQHDDLAREGCQYLWYFLQRARYLST